MKLPWGLHEETGRMVNVDAVPNGKLSGCICPACERPLLAKNHGRQIAHHFAHAAQNSSCEGWLHAAAKRLLYDRISTALADSAELLFEWRCEECSCEVHSGDLLKPIDAIEMEKRLDNIRPDLYLAGKPTTLIEIVDTHPPEDSVLDFAEANRYLLLVFRVTGDERLCAVNADVLKPEEPVYDGFGRCRCKKEAERNKGKRTPCFRWCAKCAGVVEDWYGEHGHCVSCGDLKAYNQGRYAKHYCCFWTDKFRLPRCEDRNPAHPLNSSHGHCSSCGNPTREAYSYSAYSDVDGAGFFRRCHPCATQEGVPR